MCISLNVIGIIHRVQVHKYPNASNGEYLHNLSRNIPKQMRQRGCSGSVMRKYQKENRVVQAKSFNPCNFRLLHNYRLQEGKDGNL